MEMFIQIKSQKAASFSIKQKDGLESNVSLNVTWII